MRYDQSPFIGYIESFDANLGFYIKTLDRKCNSNSFTLSNWQIICKESQVLSKIGAPNFYNNRGQLCLSKSDYAKFKSYL